MALGASAVWALGALGVLVNEKTTPYLYFSIPCGSIEYDKNIIGVVMQR